MSLSILDAAHDSGAELALVTESQNYTFAQLASLSLSRAQELHSSGYHAGVPLALLGTATLDTAVTIYAALSHNIPLLIVPARFTAAEQTALLQLAGLSALFEPAAQHSASATKAQAQRAAPLAASEPIDPEAIAAILATSGSSGFPKLVCLSRRAFLHAAHNSAANLGFFAQDRWLLSLPLSHIGGLSILTRCLIARKPVALFEQSQAVLQAVPRLARILTDQRVSLVSLVPALLRALLADPHWQPPTCLRAVLLGGAPPPRDLLAQAEARGVPVLVSYGMTETCSQITTEKPGHQRNLETLLPSSGLPLPHVELKLDAAGLIWVRSASLFSGYWAEQPYPFQEGWFCTHDRGYRGPQGELFVLGRQGDLIITGGENVDPLEVEFSLAELPHVAEICVFGQAHPEFGQTVCIALVLSDPEQRPSALQALRERSQAVLAPYKRPRHFSVFASFPRLTSGKLDRRQIAELAAPTLQPLPRANAS